MREVLRLLAQQGLVEHLPRHGMRMASLSERDVQELFGLRDVLGRYVGDLARPSAKQLDAALEAMEQAAELDHSVDLADAHRAFHLALVALARQRQLLRRVRTCAAQAALYMAISWPTSSTRR